MKPKKLLLLTAALTACAALVVAAAESHGISRPAPGQETPSSQGDQARAASSGERRAEYVHPGGLLPTLRGALRAMGDRLERPGKERVRLTGTLTLGGEVTAFTLVSEFPGKLRLERAGKGGSGGRVIVFDERGAASAAADGRDADLIETLAFDTPEHFFEGQARGVGTRLLGTRFRADGDSPLFHDIYQVSESSAAGGTARRSPKTYYFNSDTLLLERVKYEDERGGATVTVEVEFEWQQIEGQRVPRRVARTEDGRPVLTMDVDAAGVGGRTDDATFIPVQR